LGEIVGVKAVHDVHVWQLSAGRLSASVHLRTESQTKEILKEAIKTFK
jgi:Co/Zn/Cd efflux system component